MARDLPERIAVLGAGPVGLEAALYGRYLGYAVDVYERGRVAENVLRWGHVRMFSPFGLNRSTLALAALGAQDPAWHPPADDAILTGRELAQRYLVPLAQSDLLADGLHERTEVLAVSRDGPLKGDRVGGDHRREEPFRLLLRKRARDGFPDTERIATADVVIDTTGTYGNHNWLGRGGIPALGERAEAGRIDYDPPDIAGQQRERFAGRHVLVVGAGYSAATSVAALAQLAGDHPGTRVTWITRDEREPPVRLIPEDRLPQRDRLAREANHLAADTGVPVTHGAGTTVDAVAWHDEPGRFEVRTLGRHEETIEVDRVIANVGYRPDLDLARELQMHWCYASEGPMKLAAALLGTGAGDCLDQRSHGPRTLANPEPDFYVLGAKSYGRNSNFLISIGLEQVRDAYSLIAGRADLDLYSTVSIQGAPGT